MKNPDWQKDEILLALDLYFSPDRGSIDKKNQKIIALSEVLNSLPIHSFRPDQAKFRNPNGVVLKLSNFLALDENYKGKGMGSYSNLDEKLFNTYSKDKEELKRIVAQIRQINADATLKELLNEIDNDHEDSDGAKEGGILFKYHKLRERNKKLIKKKKEQVLKKKGKLICEACDFDFSITYPGLGDGFIECHHRIPLSETKVERKTNLEDLALVCANCHRMLHRRISTLTVEELRKFIISNYTSIPK